MRCRRLTLLVIGLLIFIIPVGFSAAVPIPAVTLSVPDTAFISESFDFSVTFRNNDAADIGYGPFLDIWLPRNGADGASGTATPDGVSFIRAEYLDTEINAEVFTFPGTSSGCVTHPYLRDEDLQPVQVCGTSGDELVVVELPFGSFSPAQPDAEIVIRARMSELADLEVPLSIRARGGFRFGADAIDNPCCDLPIVSPEQIGAVTPILMTMEKTNDAPESEIPAGPNFPHSWIITLDIANNQTITDLDVTDFLPPSVTYLDVVAATPPLSGPPVVGGGQVTFNIASVTGTSGDVDVSIEFEFYADEVLDPVTGAEIPIYNSSEGVGDWLPNDGRDDASSGNAYAIAECIPGGICVDGDAAFIVSLAVQKTVTPLSEPVRSGVVLEYTVDFQVSDYFSFDNVEFTDIISDGQHLDPGFQPRIDYTEHGVTTSTTLDPANYDVFEYWTGGNPGVPAPAPAVNGDTVMQIRISDQVGDPLLGGCIPPGGTPNPDCSAFNQGPTTGTLTYRTIVLDNFVDNFPSGDSSVDHGDILSNYAEIVGQLPNAQVIDDTEAETEITRGELDKSLYAVNGVPCNPCVNIQVTTGDTLTYRIRQEMPSSDFEDFQLVDFLPLPVFNAAEVTTFNYTIDAAVPPAGTAKFYTGDTLYNIMRAVRPADPQYPVIQINNAANSVTFDYGAEFDDPQNRFSVIDILFTVTVTDMPFADELNLANLVQSQEDSTNAGGDDEEDIVIIEVVGPFLVISKGIVGSTDPNAQFTPPNTAPVNFNPPGSNPSFAPPITSDGLANVPIDSDLNGAKVGDVLTFAIVVENLGHGPQGAFDIQIRDSLTPGFVFPAGGLNLQAHLGNGVPVNYTPLGSSGTDRDLFDQGIELIDPGVDGACGPYDGDDGLNIIVITYDLQIGAITEEVMTNTASIVNYSSREGGTDYTGNQDLSDQARIIFGAGGGGDGGETGTTGMITKSVDKPFAQPGEQVRWTVTVTNTTASPLSNVSVNDTLPAEIEPISAVTTRGTVTLNGQSYIFDIGTLNPGDSVRMTIDSRIRSTIQPPYVLINTAVMLVGGQAIDQANASVLSATNMPNTGESRYNELRSALFMVSFVVMAAGVIVFRARYQSA